MKMPFFFSFPLHSSLLILVATGRKHAAIYCNDDNLESLAVKLGKSTGDLVHPIPYSPEFYKPEFKSDVSQVEWSINL